MGIIDNLEALLARGQDNPLLRFGLGQEYWKAGQAERAIPHLALAVATNPDHSASWKLYGRALADIGRLQDALDAFARGIEVAERRGDIQAAKEMGVFRRRIERKLNPAPPDPPTAQS